MTTIEREIRVELPSDVVTKVLYEYRFQVPPGKVQRVTDLLVLDKPSQDFEIALEKNDVRRGAIYASTAYFANAREPTQGAFNHCRIENADSAYFVVTRLNPTIKTLISAKVHLTIDES